jgi:S-adenosylmethionine decarboxylase
MDTYGKELILDLHDCKPDKDGRFTRGLIEVFMEELCDAIDMERHDLHFWDYEGEEDEYQEAPTHLRGTSAIQFITTSNVTIHTLDDMRRVYLNIFSCKDFDAEVAKRKAVDMFGGKIVQAKEMNRI